MNRLYTRKKRLGGLLIMFLSNDSHSDIHNINGELPMTTNVAGHEGIGRVVKGLYL